MAEILQYVHIDGIFHRLSPFSKILLIIVVAVMCILSTSIPFLLLIAFVLFLLAYISHLHRELIRQLRLLLIMSVLFIAITILTMPNGAPIGSLIPSGIPLIGGAIPITFGALMVGIILALRFIALIFAFQLFLISTQPRDLVHALDRLHMPVDYILMFIIALRFIPTLQIEGRRIHEAQIARGYNPGTGLLGKIRSVSPIVIPLVSNALLRSTVLGLTIDMRGYRTGNRTRVRERKFSIGDYCLIGTLAISSLVFIAVSLISPGLIY